MSRQKCNFSCFKSYQNRCLYAVFFGLGLGISCFCPEGLTLFLAAVILVALGISLLKH